LRVDAIVTVVDARAIGAALIDSLEARMQVNRADVVVLNKLDLVPDGGAQAQEHIRAHNGQAPMLHAVQGRVPWPLVLGHGANAPARAVLETAPGAEHGHGHGSARYQTYSYTLPADRAVDEAAVEALTYRVPEAVFRFKGLLRVDSPEGPWLLVNGVAGRIDLRFLTPEPAPKVSAMVFIGRALNAPALQALCAEALSMDS
jgi:G3E family GTPase